MWQRKTKIASRINQGTRRVKCKRTRCRVYEREHNKHANQEIRTTNNINKTKKESWDETECQRQENTYQVHATDYKQHEEDENAGITTEKKKEEEAKKKKHEKNRSQGVDSN